MELDILKPILRESANFAEEDIAFDLVVDPERVRWEDLFDDDRPVEVEFGSGTGRFILDCAARFPKHNYVAVEFRLKWFKLIRSRVIKRNLPNIRVLCADAKLLVESLIPENQVLNYHIHHPDPWPKTRHRKRRLFQPRFCSMLKRGLVPGGHVFIMTDVEEYFRSIVQVMNAYSGLARLPDFPDDPDRIITNYEEKATKRNIQIHRTAYQNLD
ncbi:MAG: tRNA (guanosine(46)-N7)-methyltransferase TrmB [Candidatus Cloacimonetes bacterium 4572_55]|nr:MAG: tRNA (guanosine(46)-N7)-methyltransferase TrmB [Candidatus Cloacimonetes bacterium 4572_55]